MNEERSDEIIIRCMVHLDECDMKCTHNIYTHFTQKMHLEHRNNYKYVYYKKNERGWNDHTNFDDLFLT